MYERYHTQSSSKPKLKRRNIRHHGTIYFAENFTSINTKVNVSQGLEVIWLAHIEQNQFFFFFGNPTSENKCNIWKIIQEGVQTIDKSNKSLIKRCIRMILTSSITSQYERKKRTKIKFSHTLEETHKNALAHWVRSNGFEKILVVSLPFE